MGTYMAALDAAKYFEVEGKAKAPYYVIYHAGLRHPEAVLNTGILLFDVDSPGLKEYLGKLGYNPGAPDKTEEKVKQMLTENKVLVLPPEKAKNMLLPAEVAERYKDVIFNEQTLYSAIRLKKLTKSLVPFDGKKFINVNHSEFKGWLANMQAKKEASLAGESLHHPGRPVFGGKPNKVLQKCARPGCNNRVKRARDKYCSRDCWEKGADHLAKIYKNKKTA